MMEMKENSKYIKLAISSKVTVIHKNISQKLPSIKKMEIKMR